MASNKCCNVRLRIRLVPSSESAAVDVEFVATEGRQSTNESVSGKFRLTSEEVLTANNDGEFVTPAQPFQLPGIDQEADFAFRRILLDRTGMTLTASVNGRVVGQWPIPETAGVKAVFRCAMGDTQFADIDIVELGEQSATATP